MTGWRLTPPPAPPQLAKDKIAANDRIAPSRVRRQFLFLSKQKVSWESGLVIRIPFDILPRPKATHSDAWNSEGTGERDFPRKATGKQ